MRNIPLKNGVPPNRILSRPESCSLVEYQLIRERETDRERQIEKERKKIYVYIYVDISMSVQQQKIMHSEKYR